ncbi:YecA family protein [Desulfobacter latus]|uniref:YecA family protein n=1 Tax=Desulfobacter latus TaxID=2292 RepID=UPI001FE35D72|nr:SEC-C metal-binding domain-containing protein [Desulfobacter latus]
MRTFIWILFVLFLVVSAVILPTLLFLGVGYIFSIILPLNLFENAIIAIGSTFVVAFCIGVIIVGIQMSQHDLFIPHRHLDEAFDDDDYDDDDYDDDDYDDDDYDDDEDYEEDDYEDGNTGNSALVAKNTPKIGRNELCPCGSGLKYKRCCGK